MLTFKEDEWSKIFARIKEEYRDTPAVYSISFVTKRELGFTVRHHQEYVNSRSSGYPRLTNTVCLDFYDDAMETFFALKYCNL
jgi:hypothetical protein